MGNTIRVPLPGYNAKTDTNLDHFALYTDQDNVLIKEFTRNTRTISGGATATIAHNLGYVPLFLVFVNDTSISANTWSLVGLGSILSSLFYAGADETNLVIANLTGGSLTFKYFIFYDNVVGSSGITLVESDRVLKIPKAGYNALTEKDPNNLIFHSDLNSFKIVYQEKKTVHFINGTDNYQFAHNSLLSSTSCLILFIQFPDGKVTQMGWYGSPGNSCKSYNQLAGLDFHDVDSAYFDNTNIYLHCLGAVTYDVNVVWYIFEAGL